MIDGVKLQDETLMEDREQWLVRVDVDGHRMEETKQYWNFEDASVDV
jgi:hypothetical protein